MAKEDTEREEQRKENDRKEPAPHKGGRRNQKSAVERVVTSSAFNTVLRGVFNMLVKKKR